MIKKRKSQLLLLLIVIIVLLLFNLKSLDDKSKVIKLGGEDAVEKVTEASNLNDMIRFPRLQGTYRIDENNQHLTLTNPEVNDVLMKFTYKLGEEVLLESDWIEPSKSYNGNVYELLPAGNYTIHMIMETIDIATHVQCTGLTAKADIIVNKGVNKNEK